MSRLVCLILLAGLCGTAAGCSGDKTVYVTGQPGVTITQTETQSAGLVKTLTQTVDGTEQTSVVTLSALPPSIPHPPYLESYGCAQCHPYLPGHEGHSSGNSVCFACHTLAVQSSG